MQVKSILAKKGKNILTVQPSTSVQNVTRLMAKHNIGAAVISHDGARPDGIITERDVVRGVGTKGSVYLKSKCADACYHKVITCTPQDDVYRVMMTMKKHRFRHMPVTQHGMLVGMISVVDILRENMNKKEIA